MHHRDILSIFFSMKVYCVFSLESPQRDDSNEYTQYTISQYKKENHPKLSQICNYGICSKELKNEFKTAMVKEPSVVEPQKFYCNDIHILYKTTTKLTTEASTKANILGKCLSIILEHQKIQRQFFLFLNKNICCDPSLEPSQRDGSNDGSQNMFL